MNTKCCICGDVFTDEDIKGAAETGDPFHLAYGRFVCPDCYDNISRLPLEEQLGTLLKGDVAI